MVEGPLYLILGIFNEKSKALGVYLASLKLDKGFPSGIDYGSCWKVAYLCWSHSTPKRFKTGVR